MIFIITYLTSKYICILTFVLLKKPLNIPNNPDLGVIKILNQNYYFL